MTEKRDLNNEVSESVCSKCYLKSTTSNIYFILLFNQLILMKKTIQQAKVCVIAKLIRKLKNLTNRQGKELTGLKLIGKRSRLTEQISYLKVGVNFLTLFMCPD